MRPLHRHLVLLALVAVAAISLLAASPAQAGQVRLVWQAEKAQAEEGCQGADTGPREASGRELVRATLCLLNDQRERRGLAKLRLNQRLSGVAADHAADMVRRTYFSHQSLTGASFVDRIRRSGYLRSVSAWSVGENLAWGSGTRSTPRSIMRAWMNSPGHRANILEHRYREIGIGIASGAPKGSWDDAATYATEFGFRR
jgi:uncharacterized protein YkwD